MYSTGSGISQDFVLAEHWLRKAPEQGDAIAQYNLGLFLPWVGKNVSLGSNQVRETSTIKYPYTRLIDPEWFASLAKLCKD